MRDSEICVHSVKCSHHVGCTYMHLHRRLIKLGSLCFYLGACCFVLCQCNYLHHCSHASSQRIFASCNCDSWYPTRSCPQSCCAKHTLTFFRSFQAGHNKREGVKRKLLVIMMVIWTWHFCLFLRLIKSKARS